MANTDFSNGFAVSFWIPWADLLAYIQPSSEQSMVFWYWNDISTDSNTTLNESGQLNCFRNATGEFVIFQFGWYASDTQNVMTASVAPSVIEALAPANASKTDAHVMIAADSSSPPNVVFYIDDNEVFNGAMTATTGSASAMTSALRLPCPDDAPNSPWLFILYDMPGTSIGEFWFNLAFLDWSVASNRDLFQISNNGNYFPCDLGFNGQLPIGSPPNLYHRGNGAMFFANMAEATQDGTNWSAPIPYDGRAIAAMTGVANIAT